MHYYSRNIPAYALDTSHLNMIEDGAYNRLIDMYYTQEAPLTTDLPKLFRVLRARSPEEQEAVKVVLDEYFTKTEDGYSHKRCNKEIVAYHDKAAKNRVNGAKGGRPPKQETTPVIETAIPETQSVISGLPEQTLTVNRKPETINQEENTVPNSGHGTSPSADEPVSASRFRMDRWLKAQGVAPKDITAWLAIRKVKKAVNTEVAAEELVREAGKARLSVPDAVHESTINNWAGFKASWLTSDRRSTPRGDAVVVGSDPDTLSPAVLANRELYAARQAAKANGGRAAQANDDVIDGVFNEVRGA